MIKRVCCGVVRGEANVAPAGPLDFSPLRETLLTILLFTLGGLFLGAAGIYPLIPNTIAWVANNVEGVYKRGIVIGVVVGSGNLHGVVSSNIYMSGESPRFWTGHGIVLAFLTLGALCGSIGVHIGLRIENAKRRSGKRDHMLDGFSEYDIKIAGDKRPDFIYSI